MFIIIVVGVRTSNHKTKYCKYYNLGQFHVAHFAQITGHVFVVCVVVWVWWYKQSK